RESSIFIAGPRADRCDRVRREDRPLRERSGETANAAEGPHAGDFSPKDPKNSSPAHPPHNNLARETGITGDNNQIRSASANGLDCPGVPVHAPAADVLPPTGKHL